MVSKNILIQYADLQHEIEELEERRNRLGKQLDHILDGGTVTDMVTGGFGGVQHFKIEGFPVVEYERVRKALGKNIQMIEEKCTELIEMQNEVEEYMDSIGDSRMRRIVRMRFMDRLSWFKVAEKVGGQTTADSVRMEFNRFFTSK